MSDWQQIIKDQSIASLEKLADKFGHDVIDVEALKPDVDEGRYRSRVSNRSDTSDGHPGVGTDEIGVRATDLRRTDVGRDLGSVDSVTAACEHEHTGEQSAADEHPERPAKARGATRRRKCHTSSAAPIVGIRERSRRPCDLS